MAGGAVLHGTIPFPGTSRSPTGPCCMAALAEGRLDHHRAVRRRRRRPHGAGGGRPGGGGRAGRGHRGHGDRWRTVAPARRRPRPSTWATRAPACACWPGWPPPSGTTTLTGDDSLRARPMDRVAEPLGRDGGRGRRAAATAACPRSPSPAGRCDGIDYTPPMASAQVKSAVLLAGIWPPRGRRWSASRSPPGPTPRRCWPRPGPDITSRAGRARDGWSGSAAGAAGPGACLRARRSVPGRLLDRGQRRSSPAAWSPWRASTWAPSGSASSACSSDGGHHRGRGGGRGTGSVTSYTCLLQGTVVEADEIPSLDEVPILAVAASRGPRHDPVPRRRRAPGQGVRPAGRHGGAGHGPSAGRPPSTATTWWSRGPGARFRPAVFDAAGRPPDGHGRGGGRRACATGPRHAPRSPGGRRWPPAIRPSPRTWLNRPPGASRRAA